MNYLKSKVGTTEQKNTELLSWLIDFEPRPFLYGKRYIVGPEEEEEQEVAAQIEEENEIDDTEAASEFNEQYINKLEGKEVQIEEDGKRNSPEAPSEIFEAPKSNFRILTVVVLSLCVISVGVCVYLLSRPGSPQGCMYWADDHYEPVSCNQKVMDKLVLALDSVKLHHFKRITEPDTITCKSKGSVWYVKINDRIEFYTSDGFHPVQLEKRLRPVTDYIIYKYVYQK